MRKSTAFYLTFSSIALAGGYLRLDQFALQVLLDDEWHVIHQLLAKTPKELFLTISHADFSIPLALLYWLELKFAGLSELAMRWPMMLAGLLTLVLFPLYVRKFFGDKTTLLFSVLLAISPILVIYSRTARPYALTLLFSLLALAAFHKFVEKEKGQWGYGIGYAVSAVLSVWMHLIVLPFVVAPFLLLGIPALLDRDWQRLGRIFWVGLTTLSGLLLLVLPPILGQPEALGAKMGAHLPNLQTYQGAVFLLFGTSSSIVVSAAALLAIYGAAPLWRKMPLIRSLVTGLGFTFGVILLVQPEWVHNPLTFARYLLPAIPLFLLSLSVGVARLSGTWVMRWGGAGKFASGVATVIGLSLMAYFSPLSKILAKPNSNSLHSVYQFDFRDNRNLVALYQQKLPLSPFWQMLSEFPPDSLKIAASPFHFATHHWDAARWERISRQRVMPGFLNGLCNRQLKGEVPRGRGFNFQNAGYLEDRADLLKRGFDLVVYQKPFSIETEYGEEEIGVEAPGCEAAARSQFPSPVFEDEWLVVFPLSEDVRDQFGGLR